MCWPNEMITYPCADHTKRSPVHVLTTRNCHRSMCWPNEMITYPCADHTRSLVLTTASAFAVYYRLHLKRGTLLVVMNCLTSMHCQTISFLWDLILYNSKPWFPEFFLLPLPFLVTPSSLSSSHHLSLNREGRWGTTDDSATYTSFNLYVTL